MYCPRCSQQLLSDELRFCSRCGFAVGVVRDVIASGAEVNSQIAPPSSSQKNVRRGTWLMIAALAIFLFVAFISAMDDDFAPFLILPALCFLLGFISLVYGVFFAEKREKRLRERFEKSRAMTLDSANNIRARELQAPRDVPSFAPSRTQTAEMVEPRSVTENTTRLLDDERS